MREKNNSIFKTIMIIVVTAFITCIITTFTLSQFCTPKIKISSNNNGLENLVGALLIAMPKVSSENEESEINDKIYEIQSKIDEVYMGTYDKKDLINGAIAGYVDGLGDVYTEYLDEDEIQSLKDDVNGGYVGVGVYIAQNQNTHQIVVVGVFEDSPGDKAGIIPGDVIKKIYGVEFTGEQLTQASKTMKGIEGTKVKLTIERDSKEIDLDIIRKEIKQKCVKSQMLDNNIGYIRISAFNGGCASDFKKAYEDLKSKSAKSLIIDMRNNGGGLVDEALDIAEMIVPKGSKMLITVDKKQNEEISISQKEPIIDIPIVVLVNEYTASASEILTAAIRENIDSKVIGTNTYGKGVIQGIYLLKDQKTGLKLTIQEYYTPNHNKLNKIGIEPDEIVELPEEAQGKSIIEEKYDTQLNRAIEILK